MLNRPGTQKCTNLALVAFHAFMATFTASAIQSAFAPVAEDLAVSLQATSYLVSLFIAVLGGAPLFWRPVSNRWGRRPIFLVSLLGSLAGNLGCANSPGYGTMALCRAITAFFISPAAAIGSAVVAETFFKRDRARAMGVWTLLVTIGVPASPFVFGFVALRVEYRWIYYILAITNGLQILLYTCFGPETLYLSPSDAAQHDRPTFRREYFTFTRIDPTPLRASDFLQPLALAAKPCVLLPAVAYAMVFLFGSVLPTIEIPQLFPEELGFNTQQVGLQFLGLVIGSVLGEQVGGLMSDRWMRRRGRKVGLGQVVEAEFRLWLSYIGYALAGCSVFVFLLEMGGMETYSVTPVVGTAIAAAGNQIVTTVMVTYAVDCYREEAASVGVFITFVRQIWGFIGPFW